MTASYRIVTCLLLLPVLNLTALSTDGWVHGRVVDQSSAIVPGIEVEIVSVGGGPTCRATADVEGRFRCQLPAGRFNLRATGNNIFPYQRAPFAVRPGRSVSLTLRPVFRGPGDPGRPSYQSGSGSTVATLGPSVRYWRVQAREDVVSFSGPNLELTFDTISFTAELMSCSADFLRCSGKGRVIVDVGTEGFQEFHGTSVELDLSLRRVKLWRDPEITLTF